MLQEAQDALEETNNALAALDQGKTKDALDALSRATGKLEMVVARDPELALAPVDVRIVTHDLYATPDRIRKARDEAEQLLDDGRVQDARAVLSDLASEIVISVTSLPLATYPDAIKAASPLIDAGKIDEAKATLNSALDTLVVTDHVIALPVLRAHEMLDEAEDLVNGRTKEAATQETAKAAKTSKAASGDETQVSENVQKRIDELIEGARKQLEMADLLGYGEESEHAEFRKQIAELEKRIHGDQETGGLFAHLRKSLDDFDASLFD
jgi:hypothetical protein